jgi:hypothetical protein
MRSVEGPSRLHAKVIRTVVRFSHKLGTPRFQLVRVPTVDGDEEFVRATSGHSFDVADDIIGILQNAAREARRDARNRPALAVSPPPAPGPHQPDVGPQHALGAQASSSSAAAPPPEPSAASGSGVFAPPPLDDEALAPALAPKAEGVLPVSLVDDAVP